LGHPSPTGTAEPFGLAGESLHSDQGISRSYNEILVRSRNKPDCLQGHKTVQNDISRKIGELAKLLKNPSFFEGKFGGGEWSRTTDAADMSRVDSDSNLLIY
jgi:hypothetical protein